jgi:putative ATP-binding cassette transporter
MRTVKAENPQINLRRNITNEGKVVLKDMEVDLPNGNAILENINVTLAAGENVIIKGLSGSGKSTLLRAIAGIWPYVKGELSLAPLDKVMFIPQKPYLPLGTLRESVLYPGTRQRTDEELKNLMELCPMCFL